MLGLFRCRTPVLSPTRGTGLVATSPAPLKRECPAGCQFRPSTRTTPFQTGIRVPPDPIPGAGEPTCGGDAAPFRLRPAPELPSLPSAALGFGPGPIR